MYPAYRQTSSRIASRTERRGGLLVTNYDNRDDCMEERFVAFLDILGFTEIVNLIEADQSTTNLGLERLKSVLNFMNEETYDPNYSAGLPVYTETEAGLIESELGDPRLTYVSDCIIISTEPTLDGFKALSRKIHKITADLAFDGIFCRGAISKGKLYHRDRMLFGSSYIKAYKLEAAAKNPRVIIDPEILQFFDLSDGKMPLGPIFFGRDTDDFYYQRYWTWYLFPPYAGGWEDYLSVVRGHLVKGLNDHIDNENVCEKFVWLIKEFNSLLEWWGSLFGDLRVSTIDS